MNNFTLRTYRFERPKHLQGSTYWVSRFFTLSAMVIIFFIHALWLFVAAVQHPVKFGAAHENRHVVSYMTKPLEPDMLDVRLVRSPVLLSLPTRVGFSGPLLSSANLNRPPDFREQSTEFLGKPEQPFQLDPYGKSPRELKDLARDPRPGQTPRSVEGKPGAPVMDTHARSDMTVYWMNEPVISTVSIDIPADPEELGGVPWEAVVYVCLNEYGSVTQALLENPTPDEFVNAEVLRAVRSVLFKVRPEGMCGRLMIHYAPAAPVEEDI